MIIHSIHFSRFEMLVTKGSDSIVTWNFAYKSREADSLKSTIITVANTVLDC